MQQVTILDRVRVEYRAHRLIVIHDRNGSCFFLIRNRNGKMVQARYISHWGKRRVGEGYKDVLSLVSFFL